MTLLQHQDILSNIKNFSKYIQSRADVDALFVTSFDDAISEYVPLHDCVRYYLSGFTGSTADVVVTSQPQYPAILAVDPRYHLQVDQQTCDLVDAEMLKVVKTPFGHRNLDQLIGQVKTLNIKKVGVIAERTPLKMFEGLQKHFSVVAISLAEVADLIKMDQLKRSQTQPLPPLESVGHLFESINEKLSRLELSDNKAYFLSALDDIAWVTNLRGYQSHCNSYFFSKALVTNSRVYLFMAKDHVPEATDFSQLVGEQSEQMAIHQYDNTADFYNQLSKVIEASQICDLSIDEDHIHVGDFLFLSKLRPDGIHRGDGLASVKSIKTVKEIVHFEQIHMSAAKALQQVMTWVKDEVSRGKTITEKDLSDYTWRCYQGQGAKSLSFTTIAGVGENGAIIHYGNPSADRVITAQDLILLDSGAYFSGGLATDCTRTFLPLWQPRLPQQCMDLYRRYYTLVLQGQIRAEMSVFKPATLGAVIDYQARSALLSCGYDYGHGTGHGVGVCVHERGASLGGGSKVHLQVGQILSIEPGYYRPGEFGIRLENVVVVEEHPDLNKQALGVTFLRFRPLIFLTWEEQLIDRNMLSPAECKYLDWYMGKCGALK